MGIHKHIFVKSDNTSLYKDSNAKTAFESLMQGEWMGVLAQKGEYYKVLTAKGIGWIYKNFSEEKSPRDLSIRIIGGNLSYSV